MNVGEKIWNYSPIFRRSYWLSLRSVVGIFRSVPWVIVVWPFWSTHTHAMGTDHTSARGRGDTGRACRMLLGPVPLAEGVPCLLNNWVLQHASRLRCLALHTSAFACGIVTRMPEILLQLLTFWHGWAAWLLLHAWKYLGFTVCRVRCSTRWAGWRCTRALWHLILPFSQNRIKCLKFSRFITSNQRRLTDI